MASSESGEITLKLLVDNKTNKVLFAEAGKDFVDLLFGILSLPIGDAAELVSLGSVGRLSKSVDHMGAAYLVPGADKRDLLRPKVPPPPPGADGRELLATFKMYTCPGRCVTVTADAKAECPQCKQAMATEMAYVQASSAAPKSDDESGGYVKGLVTYMVTDGLEVTPVTSSITLVNRLCVDKDVDVAEKNVAVGMEEVLALFEAALRSDTVLSDVFLATKKQQVGVPNPTMDDDVLSRLSRVSISTTTPGPQDDHTTNGPRRGARERRPNKKVTGDWWA